MKKVLLASYLALVAIPCTTLAAPVQYTCEESAISSGLESEWTAVLDVDYQSGVFNSFTIKGETMTGFEMNSKAVEISHNSALKSDAPVLAIYQKDIDMSDWGFYQIAVYGKTEGVMVGDVILVMPAFQQESYYYYKKGSLKDKLMTGLRRSHNARVTGQ